MTKTRLQQVQWLVTKYPDVKAFIVTPGSKRPLGGHSWMYRNSSDPKQLAEWTEETLDANYGIWWGQEFVAIDLDVKHDINGFSGVDLFETICLDNGIANFRTDFRTMVVRTPSGGYHIIFKTPRPCANKNLFGNGIDVRGGQGYTLFASEDSRGEWAVIDPDMPIMDIPEFLLDYLVTPGFKDPNHSVPLIELDQEENVQQATEWLKTAPPAIEGENGDDHTYNICCELRDRGISETEALHILNESGWNERCQPAWDSGELEVKIKNSYAFGQNRPGVKAVTYERTKLMAGRPAGGWGAVLTDEKVAEMFGPKKLSLVVDNTTPDPEDDEIPTDVRDDEVDPMAEFASEEQLWYGIQDFAAIDKVREYLVKGWLIAHGITALLARRGTGKSTIALDLAMHLAKDMDWWGIETMKNWKVIYICGEDDEGMILNVRAWAKYNDRGLPDNDRFLVAKDIIKMTNKTELSIRLREMREWATGARCLIILDTWARATSGYSSNTQEEMDTAYENAERVASALDGPMIACFHPPKDGRMTIRGSAVQEDASSGIWELEEISDGVKLTVGRAKGAGRGNYRLFHLETTKLEGFDSYGDKLEGIVPVKHGGTEDGSRTDLTERRMGQRRAWAKAVIGCLADYPLRNPDVEKTNNNVTAIAKFLTAMWINRGNDLNTIEFAEGWLDLIDEHKQMSSITNESQWQTVRNRLEDEFMQSADTQPVVIDKYILKVEKKGNTKNTYHFVIGATKDGVEE